MKVTTNRYGEVRIRWQYNMTDGDRDITKAFLEKKLIDKKDSEILVEVSVKRKPSERYSKEKARYFALSKLIQTSFDRKNGGLKDRKEIWDAFNTRSLKIGK